MPLFSSGGSNASLDSLDDSTTGKHRDTQDLCVSFAAAGWLQVIHFGAAQALIEHVPHCRIKSLHKDELSSSSDDSDTADDDDTDAATEKKKKKKTVKLKFAGSSAGSLASAAILLGADMEQMLEYAVGCVNYCRSSFWHALEIKRYVAEGVDRFAVDVFFKEKLAKEKKQNNNNNNNNNNSDEQQQQQQPGSPVIQAEQVAASFQEEEQASSPSAFPSPQKSIGEGGSPTVPVGGSVDDIGPRGGWLSSTDEYVFPAHVRKQLNARLQVFATALPTLKSIVFGGSCEDSDYQIRSTADLEEALVASCCLVPLAGLPFRLRRTGEWVLDGGLRAFQPRKNEPGVITVSAMYFQAADVSPSIYVPAWYGLYPPDERRYHALFTLGFNDMLQYLWRVGIVEKPASEELRQKQLRFFDADAMPTQNATLKGIVLDVLALFFYMGMLRPFALVAIYMELWFVATLAFFATVLHEFFPRSFNFLIGTRSLRNTTPDAGRRETAKDLWQVLRNLTSARTWLHLTIGYRGKTKTKRLEKYSRLYRVFAPFITQQKQAQDKKVK